MPDVPADYRADFAYLKGLSDKGSLLQTNAVWQKLDRKASVLPGLRSAMNTLNVKYV